MLPVLALLLLFLHPVALAAAPPPSFAGTWTLDAARSSDLKPTLQRLGGPTFLASLSGQVTQVISLGPESITVEVQTAMKNATATMSLTEGAEITGDLFSIVYVARPRVDGNAIVATGTITLSGEATPFETRRTVEGDVMHSVITIGSGAGATVLDRVFVRAHPE